MSSVWLNVFFMCVCMIRAGEHVSADTQQELHAESGSGGL